MPTINRTPQGVSSEDRTRLSRSTGARLNHFGSEHHERRMGGSNSRRFYPNLFSKQARQASIRLFSIVTMMRLERVALSFAGKQSIQLIYMVKRTRGEVQTPSIHFRKVTLYSIELRGYVCPWGDSNPHHPIMRDLLRGQSHYRDIGASERTRTSTSTGLEPVIFPVKLPTHLCGRGDLNSQDCSRTLKVRAFAISPLPRVCPREESNLHVLRQQLLGLPCIPFHHLGISGLDKCRTCYLRVAGAALSQVELQAHEWMR